MKRIRDVWLALPEVVRIAACILVLVIVGLLSACSHLSQPRLDADVKLRDPQQCAIEHDRLCLGQLWLYIKWRLDL